MGAPWCSGGLGETWGLVWGLGGPVGIQELDLILVSPFQLGGFRRCAALGARPVAVWCWALGVLQGRRGERGRNLPQVLRSLEEAGARNLVGLMINPGAVG